jgi:hypothetical protein
MTTVTIITPTTGSKYLEKNLQSVSNQTVKVNHTVVVDGRKFSSDAEKILKKYQDKNVVYLNENTGYDGYNGHRIYGAFSYLVNSDYVCFLDEDNWVDSNHIESMLEAVKGHDWAYSLRKIVDPAGNYICNDDCESLGKWKSVLNDNFVDVGCYMLPTNIAIQLSPIWFRRARNPLEQPEVDRLLMQMLLLDKYNLKYDTSGKYTLNYRVGNRSDSVQAEFFLWGNEQAKQAYGEEMPWRKK